MKDLLYENLYYSPALAAEKETPSASPESSSRTGWRSPTICRATTAKKPPQSRCPRVICDYIAGMTDPFIYQQYEKYCGE